MRNLHLYFTVSDCSSGHSFLFRISLVFSTTHFWIDLGFLLAILKKNISALATCTGIFFCDFALSVYVFIIYFLNNVLSKGPVDVIGLLLLAIFAILHIVGFIAGEFCIEYNQYQNLKSEKTKLALINDIDNI